MASKRTASYQLTDRNWDHEDTPEEAGTFTKAAEDVLKKRVFRTAKRRIPQSSEEQNKSFNPSNFLLTSKSSRPSGQLFGFLANMKPDIKANGSGEASDKQEDADQTKSTAVFSFGVPKETKQISPVIPTEKNGTDKTEATHSGPMFSFKKNIKDGYSISVADKTPSFNAIINKDKLESNTSSTSHSRKSIESEKTTKSLDNYYSKLKGLNESVAKWINKHVEGNPLINLQPIFKDYEKFFDEIEKERDKCNLSTPTNFVEISQGNSADVELGKNHPSNISASKCVGNEDVKTDFKFAATSSAIAPGSHSSVVSSNIIPSTSNDVQKSDSLKKFSFGSSTNINKPDVATSSINMHASDSSPKFSFGNTKSTKCEETTPFVNVTNTASKPLFSFGNQNTTKLDVAPTSNVPTSDSTPKFSFGSTSTSSTGFSGFSFKPSAPINFGVIHSSTPVNTEENKNEEESDEPPKLDVKQVEEEGHIYSIRCKLFVKKDGNFVEKGIGSLFLKPVPNSDKIQMIVRAHNSLGNVLCNIILSKSIPTQRMGKNNVMIVCIPTPESQQPVPVLIKVKTGEDADQLLETLEKHKQ